MLGEGAARAIGTSIADPREPFPASFPLLHRVIWWGWLPLLVLSSRVVRARNSEYWSLAANEGVEVR
jgi:hypothetical protein